MKRVAPKTRGALGAANPPARVALPPFPTHVAGQYDADRGEVFESHLGGSKPCSKLGGIDDGRYATRE